MSKELLSEELLSDIDRVAQETGFTGVLRIGDDVGAYGLADRAHELPNERRDPVRHRERDEGAHGAHRRVL